MPAAGVAGAAGVGVWAGMNGLGAAGAGAGVPAAGVPVAGVVGSAAGGDGLGGPGRRRPRGGDRRDRGGGDGLGRALPGAGEVAYEQVRDGDGLLDRSEVAGGRHDGEPGVRNACDQHPGIGGRRHLVVGTDHDQSGHGCALQLLPNVERGQRLAGGGVAVQVRGADHLDGPVHDGGLGAGEDGGEPALGRGAGHGLQAAGADLGGARPPPLVVGGGADQGQRGQPLRMP
ncbi:hypothetical protein GCM10020000_15960 [Streptomyces olivoverticillatus]